MLPLVASIRLHPLVTISSKRMVPLRSSNTPSLPLLHLISLGYTFSIQVWYLLWPLPNLLLAFTSSENSIFAHFKFSTAHSSLSLVCLPDTLLPLLSSPTLLLLNYSPSQPSSFPSSTALLPNPYSSFTNFSPSLSPNIPRYLFSLYNLRSMKS